MNDTAEYNIAIVSGVIALTMLLLSLSGCSDTSHIVQGGYSPPPSGYIAMCSREPDTIPCLITSP
jgi:hypothetical protein